MSKIEETAKKVIDELLDHDENFQNTESYPTRCEDTIQVLGGCSKILKGSYRINEIAQKIKDLGIPMNIVKKFLSALLCLFIVLCFGCGNQTQTPKEVVQTPKEVVESFISACKSRDYEKASKMYYNLSKGVHLSAGDTKLKRYNGEEREEFYLERYYGSAPMIVTTIKVTRKYWLSAREAVIDKDNPNKCTVFVFLKRTIKPHKNLSSNEGNITMEQEWYLEKINGKWMITIAAPDMIVFNRP